MDTSSSGESPRPGPRWRAVATAVSFAAVLAIGLFSGWFAARQTSARSGEHAEEPVEERAGSAVVRLDPRTLANLGVESREVVLGPYVETRGVPADVVLLPEARRPLHAPVSGRVVRVSVDPREVVGAGQPVAEILRDPFPRPTLLLTDALIRPLNEDFHRSIGEIRTAVQSLAIVRDELRRIRSLLGTSASGQPSALPGKVEVDLLYEERRAVVALDNARREAERHGLMREEIAAIEAGGTLPADLPLAQRILARNGLWNARADRVRAALPEAVRDAPYTAAVIGELVGVGRLDEALVQEVVGNPRLAAAFLDVAGLLQGGLSAEALRRLDASAALESLVVVVTPSVEGVPDLDVAELRVREGARVEAGDVLADLVNGRLAALRLAPAGSEIGLVVDAVEKGTPVRAEPLVEGSGPELEALVLEQLPLALDGPSHEAGGALARVRNVACVDEAAPCRFRTWKLRPGLRYVVHLPVSSVADRFVLPADSVVARGPDSIVMLADGDGFRPVVVRVERRTAREAVLANDGALFPGDRVVVRGAYALSLALQTTGPVDPHAGHNH